MYQSSAKFEKINNIHTLDCSSHTRSSISIDLFNIPPLPDTRRQTTILGEFQNDFFLPDKKNSRLSQIAKTWTFSRLTPDGNENVGVKIGYLEHTYGTKNCIIDHINGQIKAIHEDNIELTEFTGCFSPFNLNEPEKKVCRFSDPNMDLDEFMQCVPVAQQHTHHQAWDSNLNSGLQSIKNLMDMGFTTPHYSPILPGKCIAHNNQGQQYWHPHLDLTKGSALTHYTPHITEVG